MAITIPLSCTSSKKMNKKNKSGVSELSIKSMDIDANGFAFSTRISGDKKGIPVLLLHGFPESSVMWDSLMIELNKIGYYTLAPNQRGYSKGARPNEIAQYHIKYLAEDIIAIADALSVKKFHLIGHDWGSAVGWQIASEYPERLFSYTALSVPHLDAFSYSYREDSLQYKASDYIRFFQTKDIPEETLSKNQFERLRAIWSVHSDEEVKSYIELFGQENALNSAINWYRANYSLFEKGSELGKIDTPVLFIWGNKDSALQRSGVEATKDYVNSYYRFVELDAGHWLVQGSYDTIQKEISSHLSKFK